MMAAGAIRWRRVGGLLGTLSFVEQFFAGVFIPVRVIPMGLRWISYMLPSTWVIDATRSSFLGLEPLVAPRLQTGILIGLALITNLCGFVLVSLAEKRARRLGLTDQY
jgi:ABC-type multidrug transport system permease subunit